MKVTTWVMDKQKQDTEYGSLPICPDWVFSSFFSAIVLVTTGRLRLYIQSSQVAQVVQPLQDGALICVDARRFAVSPSTVSRAWRRHQRAGHYSRRARQGRIGHQPSSRPSICSSVWGETGGELPPNWVLQNDLQQATGEHVSNQTVRNIVLTHESRFTLSTRDRREGVWRHYGERYAFCNIIQHD